MIKIITSDTRIKNWKFYNYFRINYNFLWWSDLEKI